ncbi:MAG: MGMT family protein [Bacteroidota bacterium]
MNCQHNDFFKMVYYVTKQIPYGRVTSYGAIANYLGSPGAARTVGWALNKSVDSNEWIPAHRVVNRNGMLTGKRYFGGSDTMKELLESEGVIVVDDRVEQFDEKYWNPAEHILYENRNECLNNINNGYSFKTKT